MRLVVERADVKEILDLENFICTSDKRVIGYIEDVIGPINDPLYIVSLYPDVWTAVEKGEYDAAALIN